MGEGGVQQGPEPRHPHTHSNSKHKRGGTPGEGVPSDPHGTQRWTVRRVPPKMIKGAGTLGRKGVLWAKEGGQHPARTPHRPLPPPPPPPPPPPWPPASGAPDIMRKRTTGTMYIHWEPAARGRMDRCRETEKRGEVSGGPASVGEVGAA